MRVFAWAILGGIILIILALGYYLLVGQILFKIVFSRRSLSSRVLRKDTDKKLKEYKIDLCWWDKYKFTKVSTESFDQLKLSGHYYKANSDKTVIVVHGFGENYREMQKYCQFFLEKNFNVLAIDDRGHGESEGKYIGFGWLDRKDILSWLDFLNKSEPENNILLFGLSMGGTAVTCASGEKLPKNVVAIISDCAFANASNQIDHVMRKHKIVLKLIKRHLFSFSKRVHDFDIKKIDASSQVKNCQVPILFIHGSDDTFVPVENVYSLYNCAPENLKEKYIVDGAGHAMSYPIAGVLYEKKISDFLRSRTKL